MDKIESFRTRREQRGYANDTRSQAICNSLSCGRESCGMATKEALDDIKNHHVGAVHDARQVQSGLNGSRSTVAVNHVIAMLESDNPLQACNHVGSVFTARTKRNRFLECSVCFSCYSS